MIRHLTQLRKVKYKCSLRDLHLSQDLKSQVTVIADVEPVIVEKDENITLIGINRETYRNSLNLVTLERLSGAVSAFEDDKTSPVAVLYGIGSTCAGYDISEMEHSEFWLNNSLTRRHLRKPIICAVNGFCVGSGFEIALLCDLRVMEDTAVFGFFNRRMGVPMCDGGSVRLAKMIGASRTLDITMTGRRVNAKEAFEIGLINRIVATGTALGQAVNLALSIAKFTQHAIGHDRTCIYNFYESKTFNETVQDEIMSTSKEVIQEMKVGVRKFTASKTKGAKIDSFNIKEKEIPDWEREEIEIEKEYAKRKLHNGFNKET